MKYRPFINDPAHIALLDGQRYVVLRAAGTVWDAYSRVQKQVREKCAGLRVSYPAQPHVTLAGLASGTSVTVVRELVAEWVPSLPPVQLSIEKVGVFPAPFQIVIVQVRKTPELVQVLSGLRERLQLRGLVDLAAIPLADWVFHMSVAYCSAVSATAWADIARWAEMLEVPTANVVVPEVEIVAFDGGQERLAGAVSFATSRHT